MLMKDVKLLLPLTREEIEYGLDAYLAVVETTQRIFNYLKTAEKLPHYVTFNGHAFLLHEVDPTIQPGDFHGMVLAQYDTISGQQGHIKIPIWCYLLDYKLQEFIDNFNQYPESIKNIVYENLEERIMQNRDTSDCCGDSCSYQSSWLGNESI